MGYRGGLSGGGIPRAQQHSQALNPTRSLPEPTQAGRNRERAPHAHPKSQESKERNSSEERERAYKNKDDNKPEGWYREKKNENDQKTIHSDAVGGY